MVLQCWSKQLLDVTPSEKVHFNKMEHVNQGLEFGKSVLLMENYHSFIWVKYNEKKSQIILIGNVECLQYQDNTFNIHYMNHTKSYVRWISQRIIKQQVAKLVGIHRKLEAVEAVKPAEVIPPGTTRKQKWKKSITL